MLRKTFQILMLISIFFATVSCNNSQSKIDDKLPGIGTSLSDMNKYLTLQAPREINSFIIGNNIGLVIKNKSNSTIAFKPDYGIKIFSRDSGKWISVNNSIEYGDQGQELPQIGNSSPGMTVTFCYRN
jgi:hypothetical protein